MNYKTIFLTIFLMPLSAMGNNTVDARIHQLEEKLFQKEQEISSLGVMIAEKNELLSSIALAAQEQYRSIMDTRTKKLQEKKGGEALSREEKDQLYKALIDEIGIFWDSFEMAYKSRKNIAGMLLEGLVDRDEFEIVKCFIVRGFLEGKMMKKLVEKYENHIQELIAIEVELENLKQ